MDEVSVESVSSGCKMNITAKTNIYAIRKANISKAKKLLLIYELVKYINNNSI